MKNNIQQLNNFCEKNNRYLIIHKGNLCGFGGNYARTRKDYC